MGIVLVGSIHVAFEAMVVRCFGYCQYVPLDTMVIQKEEIQGMKIAILNDLHFGLRKGEKRHRNALVNFLNDTFFPHVQKEGMEILVVNGDTFDTRRSVSPQAMRDVLDFIDKAAKTFVRVYISLGNHDIFYNDSLEVNSIQPLIEGRYDNVFVVDEIFAIHNDISISRKCFIIPWVIPSMRKEVIEFMTGEENCTFFTHMDIIGSQLTANVKLEDGFLPVDFGNNLILNGHIHRKGNVGKNIMNLGAQYQMSYGDANQKKFFHVYDTETNSVEEVENKDWLYWEDKIPEEPEGKFVLFTERPDESIVEDLVSSGAEVKVLPQRMNVSDDDIVVNENILGIEDIVMSFIEQTFDEGEASVMKKVAAKVMGEAL